MYGFEYSFLEPMHNGIFSFLHLSAQSFLPLCTELWHLEENKKESRRAVPPKIVPLQRGEGTYLPLRLLDRLTQATSCFNDSMRNSIFGLANTEGPTYVCVVGVAELACVVGVSVLLGQRGNIMPTYVCVFCWCWCW